MRFMPDISMVEHRNGNPFIHPRSIVEYRNVGQQKDVARPTHLNLHDHVVYDKLRDSAGA